jgi:hypothetical protein
MRKEADRPEKGKRVAASAAWAAGIGIALVEMQYGMDYVWAHVASHVGFVVNWLPMVSALAQHIWR